MSVELPHRPDLAQLRRQAKELRRAAAAGRPEAVACIHAVSDCITLATAQLAVARIHGYSNWPKLKAAVDARLPVGGAPLGAGGTRGEPVHRAADVVGRARSRGWDPGRLPLAMILTSQSFITAHLERQPERYTLSEHLTPTNGRVFLTAEEPTVGVACLGLGASAAVTHLEELVALGVEIFISIGPAPAVSTSLAWGDCVVADAAVRDDGLSSHYLEPARYAYPDPGLMRRLVNEADSVGLEPVVGAVWTVPTPYRTTERQIEAYGAEGVLTTDLLTAALFAVGTALGVRTASAAVATHSLGLPRAPAPAPDRAARIFALLDAAIRAACPDSDGGR